MEIDFKIKNDMLVLEKKRETFSGNVNFYKCRFEILTNKELVWICVFKKGDNVYQQVIEDGICPIPKEVLMNEGELAIGCYAVSDADDFQRISTNWIPVTVLEGAYSEGTAPEIPKKDVWETLILKNVPIIGENGNWYIFDTEKMEYVDSGRMSKGEKGDKGDRGETGLPGTTNAANALKGRKIGQNITISDISSIEHEMDVKVKNKNIIPYPFVNTTTTISGVTFTDNGDGTITVNGTNTGTTEARFVIQRGDTKKLHPEKGKIYTISGLPEDASRSTYWGVFQTASGLQSTVLTGNLTTTILYDEGYMMQIRVAAGVTVENVTFALQIEEGEVATEYTPYVEDLSNVLVEVSDENGRFEEVYPSQNGSLENMVSSYPSMNLVTENQNVVLEVEYNKDINKAFSELEEKFTNAIISLGGNV